MDFASRDAQRLHALGDQHARLDRGARGHDRRPAAVLQATQGGELGRDLAERLRLQLGQVGHGARHPTRCVMLGQAVGRHDERKDIGTLRVGRVVGVVRALVDLARRALARPVERVAHRRLMRLVVRRQRPVDQTGRRVDPPKPVGVGDERVGAADGVHALRLLRRLVVRRHVGLEVRRVAERVPLALAGVPPDVALALGPRVSLGVGGRAVVEDVAVARPCPAPLGRDPVLLGVRLLARRLVDAVLVDAGMDPGAARRRPIIGEVLVLRDERAVAVAAVDLP